MIICEDADSKSNERRSMFSRLASLFSSRIVDFAVSLAHRAIFTNAAQNCVAGSRTFVHAKIYDEFIARSVELAKKRIVGDPFHEATEQGPQVCLHILEERS